MKPDRPVSATDVNREYYLHLSPGRSDYWRKMAAPRFRMKTFRSLIRRLKPGSLVDLGCGGGDLLRDLRSAFPALRLCGIDLSEAQIAANRRIEPGIEWRTADLDVPSTDLRELSNRFDVVVASEIIEHVGHPDQFLRNASLLATPGKGRLLLSTQSGRVWETEKRVGHFRHFSRPDMEALLASSGWAVERVWNAGFPFHDLSKWYANRRPDETMRRFGGEAYGIAQNAVCWALRLAFRFNSRSRGAQLFAVARRPA